MASGKTEENATITDTEEPEKAKSTSSDGDDTSTKATEENDSDTTMESKSSETKKDDTSDAETDVDDSGSSNEDTMTKEEKDKEAKEKEEAEKKRIEELKIKYKDWPFKDIKDPHDNDVMYGRGGGTNHHPGNKLYRKMVEDRKLKYVNSKRLDKPLVALEIIREWRGQLPPGRFLKHNDKTGLWEDVGDKKAREKTSQALREKAPQIRKQQEDEKNGGDTGDKTTRFAEGTKEENKKGKVKKAILARDHSLGREYLGSDENVDIGDFTWQDPFKKDGGKESSIGSKGSGIVSFPGRDASVGSTGSFPPQFSRSNVPDFYGRVSFGDQRRELSNGSIGSWGAYPPPPGGPMSHQRSGSWTYGPPVPPPHSPHAPHHQRSGSWTTGREHSFSMNPLQHTRINQPAPTGTFDQRTGSAVWNDPHNYRRGPPPGAPYPPQHPPPPAPYGQFAYESGSSMGTIGTMAPTPPRPYPPHGATTTSPPYDAIDAAARAWSGGGGGSAAPPPPPGSFGRPQYEDHHRPVLGVDTGLPRDIGAQYPHGSVPRPGMVKRDTSNQNESFETKPSRIKKAALNRDQSATSNRLKQQYIPEALNVNMQESLHERTERQLRLHSPVPDGIGEAPRPVTLGSTSRQSTNVGSLEEAMAGYMPQPKPAPLNQSDRKNTMDALGFDDLIDNSESDKLGDDDTNYSELPPLPTLSKPPKLDESGRLTTSEFLNICDISLPIAGDKDADDDAPLPL